MTATIRRSRRFCATSASCIRVGACSEARPFVRQFFPWVVVCDEILADGDWRDILGDLQSGPHDPPLIVVSRLADDRLWSEVLNLGGYDLLVKPFVASEVTRVVRMAANRGSKSGEKLTSTGGLPR